MGDGRVDCAGAPRRVPGRSAVVRLRRLRARGGGHRQRDQRGDVRRARRHRTRCRSHASSSRKRSAAAAWAWTRAWRLSARASSLRLAARRYRRRCHAGLDRIHAARKRVRPAMTAAPARRWAAAGALAERIDGSFRPRGHATLGIGIVRLADYQDARLRRRIPRPAGAAASAAARAAGRNRASPRAVDVLRRHHPCRRPARLGASASSASAARSSSARPAARRSTSSCTRASRKSPTRLPADWDVGCWARAGRAPGRRRSRARVASCRTSSIAGLPAAVPGRRLRGCGARRYDSGRGPAHRRWLAAIEHAWRPAHPALAVEVARWQGLVKGYSDTHARGWRNFQRVMAVLPQLQAAPQGAQQLRDLREAALADDSGQALEKLLASV